jgi:membrane protein
MDQRSGGLLEMFRQAVIHFNHVQGLEAAAAIAYYAIFSIFPLLLTLISVAGFLLAGNDAVDLVMELIGDIIPVSPSGLEDVLRQVVDRRDISGIIGLTGLILAASGVFATLARNINRAWPNARRQTVVRSQLIAVGLIAILATMMILWFIWSSLVRLLIAQNFQTLERVLPFHQYVLNPLPGLYPMIAAFLLFLIIYHWLPNTLVLWREALWGALFAIFTWWLLNSVFSWYIRSGWVNYDLLYGSLGTSIALLTWVFASAVIILFGAHLSASIARAKRLGHRPSGLSPKKSDGAL